MSNTVVFTAPGGTENRLHRPVPHLATLNPAFESYPDPATKHTVRIR